MTLSKSGGSASLPALAPAKASAATPKKKSATLAPITPPGTAAGTLGPADVTAIRKPSDVGPDAAPRSGTPQLSRGDLRAAAGGQLADGEQVSLAEGAALDETRPPPEAPGAGVDGEPDVTALASFGFVEEEKKVVKLPDKIWIHCTGVEGDETKVFLPRKSQVNDIRKAVCAMLKRETRITELLLDGEVLMDARKKIFEESEGPYDLTWREGDRLINLMRAHGFRSLISRLPGTKGLNRIPLHWACMTGDTDLVNCILNDKEVERRIHSVVNAVDSFGDTPMLFAAILGFADIVEILVRKNADPNLRNICGRSPIQFAAEHGHHDVVRALLRTDAEHGASKSSPWQYINIKFLAKMNKRDRVIQVIKDYEDEGKEDEGMDSSDFFDDTEGEGKAKTKKRPGSSGSGKDKRPGSSGSGNSGKMPSKRAASGTSLPPITEKIA